jgi:uncharacterized membrane protein YgcG
VKALAAGALPRLRARQRRRVDLALLGLVALAVGGVAGWAAATGDAERVAGMWAGAVLSTDGSARIVEVLDYDFGSRRRHGIFRDVPGLAADAPVAVSSATAPDAAELVPAPDGRQDETRIRIGDPSRTVSGRHRYRIEYPLDGVAPAGRLAWDAVGTGWPVGIGHAEVQLVAPFQLDRPSCLRGYEGAEDPCDVSQPEPGHLVVRVDRLDPDQGVTLYATAGRRLGDAARLPQPPGPPADAGSGPFLPGLVAAVGALAAGLATARLLRRAGRERVAAADAAGLAAAPGGEVRLDPEALASLATLQPTPPTGLAPAQGGIVLAAGVRPEHKAAWLLGAAVDGYVQLGWEGGQMVLTRLARADGPAGDILDQAFDGRPRMTLGAYDPSFAAAWRALGEHLAAWERGAGIWDPACERRRLLAWVLGALVGLAGLAAAALAAARAGLAGAAWLPPVAVAALVAGAGAAAVVAAWELRVRTPLGSRLWLQVESFRRFLAASQAAQADEAARQDLVSAYTAWALAVGELSRWSRAIDASASARTPADAGGVNHALLAPALWRATQTASVAPSSGGGGSSSGGGGAGGGAGGGGGGSW